MLTASRRDKVSHAGSAVNATAASVSSAHLHRFIASVAFLFWVAVLYVVFSRPVHAADTLALTTTENTSQAALAGRVQGVLSQLLQVNGLKFNGQVRLTGKSGHHAEAFFGKPGYILLGDNYAASLSDAELTFVLAHELVHLLHDHESRVRHAYAQPASAPVADREALHHALETEADRIGMGWAARAGAKPQEAVTALERAYGPLSGLFSTHPALRERSEALVRPAVSVR